MFPLIYCTILAHVQTSEFVTVIFGYLADSDKIWFMSLFDDIVTTVPLSVSYGGAKPLGPWVWTSNFVPCG